MGYYRIIANIQNTEKLKRVHAAASSSTRRDPRPVCGFNPPVSFRLLTETEHEERAQLKWCVKCAQRIRKEAEKMLEVLS